MSNLGQLFDRISVRIPIQSELSFAIYLPLSQLALRSVLLLLLFFRHVSDGYGWLPPRAIVSVVDFDKVRKFSAGKNRLFRNYLFGIKSAFLVVFDSKNFTALYSRATQTIKLVLEILWLDDIAIVAYFCHIFRIFQHFIQ